MTYNEGYEILEKITVNNGHWTDPRAQSQKKTDGIHDVDAYTALTAQLTSITNMLKNLTFGQEEQQVANTPVQTVLSVQCVCCGGEHIYEHCPHNSESVNYVHNRANPYSNNYNASWRQHPNFSWNSPSLNPPVHKQQGTFNFQPQHHGNSSNSQTHQQSFQNSQPPFQNKPPPQSESSSLEAMIKGLFAHAQAQNQALINQQSAAIRNLETQVSQLAVNQNNRALGTLPSNTEVPKNLGKEHVKVVTLRSGKKLKEKVPKVSAPILTEADATTLVPGKERPVLPLEKQALETTTSVPSRSDFPLLFPEDALKKSQETEVLVTPKLDANISSEPPKGTTKTQGIQDPSCSTPPSKNAIEQMSSYAKFLKDIQSKKKKLTEYETVALTEGCSALLTNSIPPKLKDPGSFTIPCSIGGKEIGKALCDLGASINLMPLSVFNTLGIGEARPTTVTLQLANKSIAYPKGKIEDVLVQVDKFIFSADFIILDFEVDKDIPIILGRPFLATGRTLIDVQKGELTMRLQDQKVTFNVFNSLKYPDYLEECSRIYEIEKMCFEEGI
ncbi:uncharacterized protein LOC112509068 [Cynara cardunculus var. scolymus]|uniref:uncharacterized protein LOC112509068 n=1 Tax=Cynara cardunculus var. scolymus TaxID=59895 RepID=UPI000D62A87B|nr:uncharacterized protein LOC112509068 [Cynara cardunculus var. scolymus]